MDNLMYVKVRASCLVSDIATLLNLIKEDIIIPHVGDAFKVILPLFNGPLAALYIL